MPGPGVLASNEVGLSTEISMASVVSAGGPSAGTQGAGDAGTTEEPPTQSVMAKRLCGSNQEAAAAEACISGAAPAGLSGSRCRHGRISPAG